jgi:D-serine deaminase-like pyridoxal phosphate-dependent protein
VVGAVKIDRLTDLAGECDLIVAVDDPVNVKELSQACTAKGVELRVLVEVDVGNKRCGVPPHESTLELAQRVYDAPNLRFAGLMAYEGFLVALEDPEERARRAQETFAPLQETYELLLESGLPVDIVSGGATATYDVTAACPPLTEIEAGSYVFMDSFYLRRRPEFEPALTVLSTVISRPVPERVLLDAGHKSLTSELGLPQVLDMEGLTLNRLAEEHAWLTVAEPERIQCRPGDKMRLMPSHCCTTVNLYDALHVVQGGVLVDVWPIAARGRVQ